MTRQLFIGLYTEGRTDIRFLESVVKRTFDNVAFEARGDFEIYIQPIIIKKMGLDFLSQVLAASKKGVEEFGITVLCIHKDADRENDNHVLEYSIEPVLKELSTKQEREYCKVTSIIIPVHMTEAWLLADTELFKKEIGTEKTDRELGINRLPEAIANPKECIKEAIRISRDEMVLRRRKNLTINEVYMPLGQKINIEKLNALPSYLKFTESVKSAFRTLNYL